MDDRPGPIARVIGRGKRLGASILAGFALWMLWQGYQAHLDPTFPVERLASVTSYAGSFITPLLTAAVVLWGGDLAQRLPWLRNENDGS